MKFRSLMTAICVLATANLAVAAPFAYVANSGKVGNFYTVSVIDTADNTVKATVNLPDTKPTVHPYAYSVAVGASGQKVFVGLKDTNEVVVIDAATNAVINRIGLGTDSPGGLAVNAAETRLYVASSMSNTLIVINISGSPTEVGRVAVENAAISNPEGVVLNSAGTKAYVANSTKGNIAEIALDEASNVYTRTNLIPLGGNAQPMGLAMNSDGSKLYVSSLNGTASIVNTSTRVATDLTVNSGNLSVAVTPDNSKIYAPSSGFNNLYVINGTNNNVTELGGQNSLLNSPWGSAVTPDGTKLYVTMNLSDNVKVFDTASNALTATIPLPAGAKPTSLGKFVGPALPYTITATNGSGCTISPAGAIPVNNIGRSFTITGTPCKVTVDGAVAGVDLGTYAFTNVTADHTIDASQAVYYLLTASVSGAPGGYLVSTPQGINPVGINAGSNTTQILGDTDVTIAAAPGYRAINWSGDCAGTADGAPCLFPNLSGPKTFAAELEIGGGKTMNVTKAFYYPTIEDLTTAAADGDIVKVSNGISSGSTSGTAGIKVTMSNQWLENDYSAKGAYVPLVLTITSVAVIADDLTL